MVEKINFLCVGAQKAGTTPLFDLLKNHTEIDLAPKKEVLFFDRDSNYNKGKNWYLDQFEFKNKITGEITPDYLSYDYVPKRIKDTLGEHVKILIMLRDPVSRTYSQYNFRRHKGKEFEKSFDYTSKINKDELVHENMVFDIWFNPTYYIERSQYYHQIKQYINLFRKDNLYICVYENFFTKGTIDDNEWSKLLKFLGVKYENPILSKPSNVSYVPKKGIHGKNSR